MVASKLNSLACFFIVFIILWMSPSYLSNDSLIYLNAAVHEKEIIHPHHLSFGVILVGVKWLGSIFFLGGAPLFTIKCFVTLITTLSGYVVYYICRQLGMRTTVSLACAGTLLFSGMLMQFAGQTECYNLLVFSLALALYALIVETAKSESPYQFTNLPYWAILIFAFSTTIHQAAAFAVVALSLFIILTSKRRNRYFAAIAFGILSGLLSLTFYIIGWRIAAPDVSFIQWMTRYAHNDNRWGLMSNFSAAGLFSLFMSWGKCWFNFSYEMFYHPLPSKYFSIIVAWSVFVFILFLVTLLGLIRRVKIATHLIWILVWVLPIEIFVLWWTPFLMNFQSLTIVPQIILLGLGFEIALSAIKKNATTATLFNRSVNFIPLLVPTLLFAVNYKYIIADGLVTKRGYPERLISSFADYVGPNDLNILEWDEARVLDLFYKKQGYPVTNSPWKNQLWESAMLSDCFTLNIHKSSLNLYKDRGEADTPYTQIWPDLFSTLKARVAGKKPIRGLIVTDGAGEISFIKLGNCDNYPLSLDETLSELSSKLAKTHLVGSKTFHKLVSEDFRQMQILNQKNNDPLMQSIPAIFHAANSDTLKWDTGYDAGNIHQTSSTISFDATGKDPFIYSFVRSTMPSYAFSKMVLTASIVNSGNVKANDNDYHMELFFMLDSNKADPAHTVYIPWVNTGREHTAEINLNEYPFLLSGSKLVGYRLDTGAIPNAHIEIKKLDFIK